MRPINLLPPEAVRRLAARRKVGFWVALGLLYVAALVMGVMWWNTRVDATQEALEEQQALLGRGVGVRLQVLLLHLLDHSARALEALGEVEEGGLAGRPGLAQPVEPPLRLVPGIRLRRVHVDDQVQATRQVVEYRHFLGQQQDQA